MKLQLMSTLLVFPLLGNINPAVAQSYSVSEERIIAQASRANTFFQKGKEKFNQGNSTEAITHFDEAIRLNPNLTQAYVYRGLAHKRLGNLEEAVEDYTQALSSSTNNRQDRASIYYNRGLVYSDLREPQEAVNDFTQAIQLNPKDADAYYQRGYILSENSQIERAIADFSKVIALKPSYLSAYVQRGVTIDGYLGDLSRATADYLKAVRLKPQNVTDYWNRGMARSALGDLRGAIADYTEAIRLNPNYSRAYCGRAEARYFLGDGQGMQADFTPIIKKIEEENRPDTTAISCFIALASNEQLDSDPELLQQISELADLAVESSPEDSIMYIMRGNISNIEGNHREALDYYRQAIRLAPNAAVPYLLRSRIWSQDENWDDALNDLNQAIELSPNYAQAYLERAILLQKLEQYEANDDLKRAIRLYTEVIRQNPNGSNAYIGRGIAYFRLEQEQEAIANFRQATNLLQKQGNKVGYQQLQTFLQSL